MRTIISRIIAPFVAAFVVWLGGLGLEVGAGFDTALTEAAVLFVLAVFGALYGVIHKVIDRQANPTDTANPDAPALAGRKL